MALGVERTQFESIRTEVNAAVPPRHDDHHVRYVLRETESATSATVAPPWMQRFT